MAKPTGESISIKPVQSEMTIGGPLGLTVRGPAKCPNWWWRLWQFLILGIVWKKVKEAVDED